MASISNTLFASLLVSLLILHLVEANPMVIRTVVEDQSSNLPEIDCGKACEDRCQLSSRPKLCKRACGTCCARCSCVPPGTSGNYDACPCYRDMTTHGGRHKCP